MKKKEKKKNNNKKDNKKGKTKKIEMIFDEKAVVKKETKCPDSSIEKYYDDANKPWEKYEDEVLAGKKKINEVPFHYRYFNMYVYAIRYVRARENHDENCPTEKQIIEFQLLSDIIRCREERNSGISEYSDETLNDLEMQLIKVHRSYFADPYDTFTK